MGKSSRFLFGTLRGRLVLSVALVHAIMMSLFIIDLTARQREMLLDRQIEEATALSEALATSSAGWIAAQDIAGLQELVDAQNRYPEVIFVIIADKDGRVLAGTDKSRHGQFMLDLPHDPRLMVLSSAPSLVDVAVPAMLSGRHVGWVRVGLGQEIASQKLAAIVNNGVIYTLAAIFIGSVIAWYMGSQITRRLYIIQQTMDAVRLGDRLARSALAGDDEAAEMAREFNSMLDNLAERDAALRESEAKLQTIFARSRDAIGVSKNGIHVFANAAYVAMFGYENAEELAGTPIVDIIASESREMISRNIQDRALGKSAPSDYESVALRKDGSTFIMDVRVSTYELQGEQYTLVILRDITERKRAEEELHRISTLTNLMIENIPNMIFLKDARELRFVLFNQAGENLLGYSRSDLLGKNDYDFFPKEQADFFTEKDRAVLRGNKVVDIPEETLLTRNKGLRTLHTKKVPLLDANGNPEYLLGISEDITERKQAEEEVLHLSRLYATLSQINQTIVRVKNPQELYISICRISIEFGRFRMAWVGLIDEQTGNIKPVAYDGHEEGYLQVININISKDSPFGKGPSGLAVRTGEVACSKNIQSDSEMQVWRNEALKRGYHSSAAVPFRCKGKIIGILNLYASEPEFFNEDEQRQLEEIGTDISFALDSMAAESERLQAEEALFKSEEKQRTILQAIKDNVVMLNAEGQIEYINHVSPGLDEKEVLGSNWLMWIDEADRSRVMQVFQHTLDSSEPTEIEHRAIGSGREMVWFNVNFMRMPQTFDKRVLLIARDITARKQSENALRDSESRYRLISENSADVIWIMDPIARKFIYVSPSVQKLRGYTPAEVMAQSVEESLTPESLQMVSEKMAHTLPAFIARGTGTESFITKVDQPRKDGSIVHTEVTTTYLFNEHGQVEIVGVSRDITEREQAEKLLRLSEEKFRLAFLTSPDAITVTRLEDGLFILVNKGFEDLTGYSEEEVIGKTTPQINLWPDLKYRAKLLEALKENRSIQNVETLFRIKNGDLKFCLVSASVIEMEGVQNAISIVRDITERKQAEDALRESEEKRRTFIEQSSEGIALVDEAGNIIEWNHARETLTGLRGENVLGKSYWDMQLKLSPPNTQTPEALHIFKSNTLAMLQDEISPFFNIIHEGEMVTVTGERKVVEQILFPVRMKQGYYIGSVVRDITERKRTELQIEEQLKHLSAMHEIDKVISSSMDLHVTLDIYLKELTDQLKVDAASVLLFNKSTLTLDHAASRGFHSKAVRQTKLRTGEGYAGKIALEGKTLHVPDLTTTKSSLADALIGAGEKFNSYVGTPLISKGQIVGVLEVLHSSLFQPDSDWFYLLEVLAGQAAIAIDNAQLFENLQRSNMELSLAYDATIEGWSRAMDLRDHETEGHTQRVSTLTVKLARQMGVPDADIIHIRRGALLHDIGKMGVPDKILLKPGALTEDEWVIMHQHASYAYEMLRPIQYLKPALDIPQYHHEKWDGTGYPHKLKGFDIPLAARIFAVVDVWDAITSDRPYRSGWSKEKAMEYIKSESGKHFDPKVLEAFVALMASE